MVLNVSIDDNNTTLIQYHGEWTYLAGSTRQWEGGIHSTSEAGASATFTFRGTSKFQQSGYQVSVRGTIPAGSGANIIDVSIDSGSRTNVSRTSNSSGAVYDELYYSSSSMTESFHTIVVTNRGSYANGNSEFMLDRFMFETSDETPMFGTTSTVSFASTSSRTPSSSPGSASQSGSKVPLGGIIGAIVASTLVIIVVLFFLLWRRRKSTPVTEEPTAAIPVPFPHKLDATTPNMPTTTGLATSISHESVGHSQTFTAVVPSPQADLPNDSLSHIITGNEHYPTTSPPAYWQTPAQAPP